jgi:hypothetical protein
MMTDAGCGVLRAPLLACIACISSELLGVQNHLPIYWMRRTADDNNMQEVTVIRQCCTKGQLCCSHAGNDCHRLMKLSNKRCTCCSQPELGGKRLWSRTPVCALSCPGVCSIWEAAGPAHPQDHLPQWDHPDLMQQLPRSCVKHTAAIPHKQLVTENVSVITCSSTTTLALICYM